MATLTNLVNEVMQSLNGYGAPAARASFLNGAITDVATAITVDSAADFNQGVVEIDSELIYIESVDTATNVLTVSPDGRGFYGTTPAAHADNARVTVNPVWPKTRIEAVINETIESTHPVLFAVATAAFTWTGVQNTYELPADCVQVLSVTADTVGPTMEQQKVNRYSVNLSAPTADFATGNSVTIQEPVMPGRLVTVTYKKAPTAITAAQDFTVSGLRSTAWKCVKLAVVSELLNYLDTARLPVDTAASAELAERNPVGSAARISTQLWQRYQIELEQERKRLAAETPVPVVTRSR